MNEAVREVFSGTGVRTLLRRSASSVMAFWLVGYLAVMSSARAADDAPRPHPVWTLVPTHIDRDQEKHIRLPAKTDLPDDLVVSVDRPIRIGPDGTFNVDGKPMQIFGIVLPDRQLVCETPGGGRWACGIRAYAVFISLLSARALSCDRISPLGATVTIANCKSGKDDIAERIIGDGWAEADKGAGIKLRSLEDAARQGLRGRWRTTMPEF